MIAEALGVWWGGPGLVGRGGVDGVLGQASPPPLVELKQNYPNPFNPATTIPFTLSGDLFANGHRPKVSLKIFNVLAQLVATPILQGTGEDLNDLELTCSAPSTGGGGGGTYTAYWDGEGRKGAHEAAGGGYIYKLGGEG